MENKYGVSFLICLIANLTFGSLYLGCRSWLNLDLHILLIVEISLLYYFLSTSIILLINCRKLSNSIKAFFSLLILFLPYLGLLIPEITRVVFNFLGLISFLIVLYFSFKTKIRNFLAFFLFFLAYALWANSYFSSWTGIIAPIFSMELAELGILHKDILYMSSMISMIQNYSVLTTGVHGLVENQTHFLPLYWHSAISKIYRIPPIQSLCTSAYLILTPLFFVTFFAVLKFRNKISSNKILFVAGLIVFLDSLIFFPITINYDFTFSVIIFCFSLLFLSEPRALNKINYLELLILLIITGFVFLIKPHTSVFILLTYCLSYLKSLNKYPYKFSVGLSLATVALLFFSPKNSIYFSYISEFKPFQFQILYPETGLFLAFVIISVLLLRRQNSVSNKFLILSHQTFFVVSFMVLRGIPDGNCHYFTYCLVLLSLYFVSTDKIFFENFSLMLDKYKNLFAFIFICATLLLSFRSVLNIIKYKSIILEPKNLQTRSDILSIKEALSSVNTKNSFIYVDPEETRIWNLVRECSSKPFLFPAYFGIASIYGVPPANFCSFYKRGYGYQAYSNPRSIQLTQEEMCEYSQKFNINNIIILHYSDQVQLENVKCNL